MNSTSKTRFFSARRFARLARAQWTEHRRGWIAFVAIGALIYVLVLGLMLSATHGKAMQTRGQPELFFLSLLISGVAFSGLYFLALQRKESALLLLMRPSTAFEKWLLAALTILLAYPLISGVIISVLHALGGLVGYQIDLLTYQKALDNEGVEAVARPLLSDYAVFNPFARYAPEAHMMGVGARWALGLVYVAVTGWVLFCSIWFKRSASLKSMALWFGVMLLTGLLLSLTGAAPEHLNGWGLLDGSHARGGLLYWLANGLFWLGTPMVLWLAALQALRERDVA